MKKHILALMIMLSVLSGCSFIPDKEISSLRIDFGPSSSSYGYENVDFETDHYTINVVNTDKSITYDAITVENGKSSEYMDVATGYTRITVDAYNSEGVKIGTGTNTVNVLPNRDNVCTVAVTEIGGEASFTVEVSTAAEGLSLTAELYRAGDVPGVTSPEKEIPLSPVSGGYSGSASVMNGNYKVYLFDGVSRVFADTVRIAAGHYITLRAQILDEWQLRVEIVDGIVKTPVITVTGGKPSYAIGESYSLTAVIEGMKSPVLTWMLDGKTIPGAFSSSVEGTIADDGSVKTGNHTFTVLAEEGDVVWTGHHEFMVTR